MIEHLDIANLRSYREEEGFDFAPITLLYGPNSAGKSVVGQSLALLKQILTPARQEGSTGRGISLRGEHVDFGNFLTAVHGHDEDKRIFLGVRVTDERSDRGPNEPPATYAGITLVNDHETGAGRQEAAHLGGAAGSIRFQKSTTSDVDFLLPPDQVGELRRALFGEGDPDPSSPDQDRVALWQVLGEIGAADVPLVFTASRRDSLFPIALRPNQIESPRLALKLEALVMDSLWTPLQEVTQHLDGLVYLGPMRVAPSRFQVLPRDHGAGASAGENTARILADASDALKSDVNTWLERLEIPYELSVDHVAAQRGGDEGPDASYLVREIVITSLLDTRTNVRVTPQDVGFGISQLLPVVVQLLSVRSGGQQPRTIIIEQPEVHVHPRLQGRLADLIIHSAIERGNQIIVETHSEHMMLRIQRRFREIEREVCRRYLVPQDVSVLYVSVNEDLKESVSERLALTERGYFEDEWPDGFFQERMAELYPPREGATSDDDEEEL